MTVTGSRFTRNVSVVMKKFLTKYDCTRTGPVNACGVSVPFHGYWDSEMLQMGWLLDLLSWRQSDVKRILLLPS